MKHLISLFLTVLVCAYTYSNDNTKPDNADGLMSLQTDDPSATPETMSWNEIMERMVSEGCNLLPDCDIQLRQYAYIKDITDGNLSAVLQIVLDNNIIPDYDSDNQICGIVTKREMNIGNNYNDIKYDFDNRNDYILQNVKPGMGLVRLSWTANGKHYHSYCVVSDSSVVYDDFITNALVYDTKVVESTTDEKETSTFTGTKAWNLIAVANWLWGKERGRAVITHQCYYSRGRIVGQDSRASSYMSIGNSAAETTETGHNKIAYGYGLSTPLVSISISFNDGTYRVTFSSSSYSAMSGTGTHIFVE